jgi:hypothetical protein
MNPQYMKLFGVVVLIMGALNSFFVNIESWMKPFGFEPKDVSIMSIGSTLMGIAGSVVSVLFVRRYKVPLHNYLSATNSLSGSTSFLASWAWEA